VTVFELAKVMGTSVRMIWVPADSTIRSIADLKGHSLALSEPRS
jgi:ABC-type phosphate/phosphonate transport system substrate-binding protein